MQCVLRRQPQFAPKPISNQSIQSGTLIHLVEVLRWLQKKGMKFQFGSDEATELTEGQVLLQCKMYVAALRIADEFGCDTIGIQYQQGLKDLAPASDLVEGLLNNADRPPVAREGRVLFEGEEGTFRRRE